MNRLDITIVRSNHLAEKVVLVDGHPGCGKTLFSPIVASLDRVELLTYAYELEHLCWLYHFDKLTMDAAQSLVGMYTDLQLYNTMMSREINFRWSDLSSALRDVNPWRYIRRALREGDNLIPDRIAKERPILNLTVHNLTGVSDPIFAGLENRAVIIEVVRHPLYMVKQHSLNMQNLIEKARHFTIYYKKNSHTFPCWVNDWQDQFIKGNTMEKAIYSIYYHHQFTERRKREIMEKYGAQIVTIPFERFVLNPWEYLETICRAIGSRVIAKTHHMLKKQNVPRRMIAQGITSPIYKRYGWQPPQTSSERQELELRKQWAQKEAGSEAMALLEEASERYEQQYMQDILE